LSKLDLTKEKIAYLKFRLGIMVAAEASLTGWLPTNFPSAHWLLVFAGAVVLLVIGFGGYAINTRIERKIGSLEEL